MKISVEQKHINQGEQEHCERCPIALAIFDSVEACFVSVESFFVHIDSESFDLPDNAIDFIESYDDGEPVSPFEFELPIEQPGTLEATVNALWEFAEQECGHSPMYSEPPLAAVRREIERLRAAIEACGGYCHNAAHEPEKLKAVEEAYERADKNPPDTSGG